MPYKPRAWAQTSCGCDDERPMNSDTATKVRASSVFDTSSARLRDATIFRGCCELHTLVEIGDIGERDELRLVGD